MKQYLKPILPYAVSVYIGAAFMNMCTNLTGSVLSDIMVYYHMNLDRGGMMSFFQFMGGIAAIIIIAGIALFAGTLHDKKLPYETSDLFHTAAFILHCDSELQFYSELAFVCRLLNSNCDRNRHTDHRVVARADQTHHLNVRRNR